MDDLRLAFRTLSRQPRFAAAVVSTLALAIGVTTGFFGVANALLLRPLPGVDDRGLVNLHVTEDGAPQGFSGFSLPTLSDLRARSRSLDALEAFVGRAFGLGDERKTSVVSGQLVTGGFFRLLGTRAYRGRLLAEKDDAPGAERVAVISHALWRERFASREDMVGSAVRVGGHHFTVVGIAEPGFRGHFVGFPIDVFVALQRAPDVAREIALESRADRSLEVVGRLHAGVEPAVAEAELRGLSAELARAHPDSQRGLGIEVRPYTGIDADLRGPVVGFVGVLAAASALALLVACINVAGLLLVRGAARRRELAVRAALGAPRAGLVRPLLAETLVLFLLGGALGAVLSKPAAGALQAFLPELPIPLHIDASPDWRVALFAAAATLAAALAFGLAPALAASRVDVVEVLKQGGRGLVPSRQRARRVFVAAQVALSLVLLVGTGLFLRELQRSRTIDPGFRRADVGQVRVNLRLVDRTPAEARAFFAAWLERVHGLPGVEACSLATTLPLGFARATTRLLVDGLEPPGPSGFPAGFDVVAPGYFETLGIPLAAGRDFEPRDGEGNERVVIVSRATASRLFPGVEATGRQIRREGKLLRVVGVVGDVAVDRTGARDGLFVYLPLAQSEVGSVSLVVRSRGRLPLDAARREAFALEPDLPVLSAESLLQYTAAARFPQRLAAAVSAAFGFFGLLLASVGLYGLVAFFAAERRHELAIRSALGAPGAELRRLVVLEGLRPVAAGIALGLAGAVAFGRLAAGFIPQVGAFDPPAFAAGALLLALVAAVAADLPARRARVTSPAEILRSE
jgi:putative ABC transport system permease protein